MSAIISTTPRASDPLKWKKHWYLLAWGLREGSRLRETIRRFRMEDYAECLEEVLHTLRSEPGRHVYIVKLIHPVRFYKLPNIVVQSEPDAEAALRWLDEADLSEFSEIWYCRNEAAHRGMVFGRMMIGFSSLFPAVCPSRVELVWGASARVIERYPATDCPFAAIEKGNWNAAPVITELLPHGEDEASLRYTAAQILEKLSSHTKRIVEAGEYVFQRGCRHLCLEFSFYDGKLEFIDWDSDHDARILLYPDR